MSLQKYYYLLCLKHNEEELYLDTGFFYTKNIIDAYFREDLSSVLSQIEKYKDFPEDFYIFKEDFDDIFYVASMSEFTYLPNKENKIHTQNFYVKEILKTEFDNMKLLKEIIK